MLEDAALPFGVFAGVFPGLNGAPVAARTPAVPALRDALQKLGDSPAQAADAVRDAQLRAAQEQRGDLLVALGAATLGAALALWLGDGR